MNQSINLSNDGRYVTIHALQSFADVLLNRGMNGEQKTIPYGDALRTRVSSQAWNRQIRRNMRERLNDDKTAISTSYLPQEVSTSLQQVGYDPTTSLTLAGSLFQAIGVKLRQEDADKNGLVKSKNKVIKFDRTSVSLNVSGSSPDRLAKLIAEDSEVRDALTPGSDALDTYAQALGEAVANEKQAPDQPEESIFKVNKKIVNKLLAALSPGDNAEIALFGRFVAELRDLNVDSSISTPDAITIGRSKVTRDDFTLVDDIAVRDNKTASGYLDSVSLTPGTFYRHAYIDRKALRDNIARFVDDEQLIDEAVRDAVDSFIESFYLAVPTSRHSRSGNDTVPYYLLIQETNHPTNGMPAFYNSVDYTFTGQEETVSKLKEYLESTIVFPSQRVLNEVEITSYSRNDTAINPL